MPSSSRRRVLHLAGGGFLTALAGCNGSDSARRSVPRESRDSIDDIAVLKVRNRTATPMVVRERTETDEHTTTDEQTTTEEPPNRRGRIMEHVTDMPDESFRSLEFPSGAPGVKELEGYFEETDFETESIYLAQSTIPECYERHLTGVYREGNGVDAQFCRTLRRADVECSADAHDMTAFAIRLPFPGDHFNSVGGGHSSRCDGPRRSIIEPDTSHTVGDEGGSDR